MNLRAWLVKHVYLFLACALILAVVPVTLSVFAFALPPQYKATFLGELKHKYDALRQTPGKRIIVIGGSSVAFGQYSDMVEAELPGYSVLNFGMYGGLGTAVMLDLARPHIHEGDILVFSPEQNRQTLSMYFNGEAMWQAADGAYRMLFRLSPDNLGAMVAEFGQFAAGKLNYYRSGSAPAPEGIYSQKAFNSYGDIGRAGRDRNVMSGGYDPNTPVSFDAGIVSREFLEYLNSFARDCRERGAELYYRACPINALAVSVDAIAGIDGFYEYLQKQLDFDIIGEPRTSVMDADWFFDTNFHLNAAGAQVNTRTLVGDLKRILNDDSPTGIALPAMPDTSVSHVSAGDLSDRRFFRFETSAGAVRIVGLTADGQQQTSLILPSEHEGFPVTTFAPELFAGNTVLTEIVVQSSFRRIENRSFDGCTSLKRLVLTHTRPETCSVAVDLLAGTDCTVYVPPRSFSAYLTSYFWSVHADRIRPDERGFGGVVASKTDPGPVRATASGLSATAGARQRLIRYDGNGGTHRATGRTWVDLPGSTGHMRVNTALGSSLFERAGYVPVGWNTAADGTGEHTGFGSRTEWSDNLVLYAQWEEAEGAAKFLYESNDGEIRITKYLGANKTCTIPEQIDDQPVRKVGAEAFAGAQIDTLILPPSIFALERRAFAESTVREIYLFDTLYYVYDESFAGCDSLTTLHINAATPPVYSGSYFDTFSDKYDWLLSIRNRKKIVLFSGSSGRFGYDSPAIAEALPGYEVANMAVYAFTSALPQLMIIRSLMKRGDILLSAPEFDDIANQFCTTNDLDHHFYSMVESSYDAVASLDLRDYDNVFDSLGMYLTNRSVMGAGSYSISPKSFDDEGNRYYIDTYNLNGDFILERPNEEEDRLLGTYLADYTVGSFPAETIQSMNAVYRTFLDNGIRVYFSYTPRNRSSISKESTAAARAALHRRFTEMLEVPVISQIEDSLYSGVYFYLIDSHLSTEGVQLRTAQVIDDLRLQLSQER